jgi:hypothetical protein
MEYLRIDDLSSEEPRSATKGSKDAMTKELDAKAKTALDESRLLILGAQVLFGFALVALMAGAAAFIALITAWYVFPLAHRGAGHGKA